MINDSLIFKRLLFFNHNYVKSFKILFCQKNVGSKKMDFSENQLSEFKSYKK